MNPTQPDTLQIWKQMGSQRQLLAAEAFYADASLKEYHRAADGLIARSKNFRPAFVKRLPVAKRASYLAQLHLATEFCVQLTISYHFAHQRPLMASFLNALGIANEDGLIPESGEVAAPAREALEEAVGSILSQFLAEDVYIYLATLASQNPDTWGALRELLPGLAAKM